jgi:uridine kinase
MDPQPPLTGLPGLAQRIHAAPPRLGVTRLVCIDGPAGSGKTTFAARLAAVLGPDAAVLHMDDVYAGWTLDGAAARLAAGVLEPLAAGRPGAFHRYDWTAGRFEDALTPVPAASVLVVEGCGSSPRAFDAWTTLRIWVEAPPALRLARGLARDGTHLDPHWQRWQEMEAAVFAAEDTRARADVRVDGAAPEPEGAFASAPDTFPQCEPRTMGT